MAGQLLARSGNLKSFAFNLLLREIKNKKIISFIIFDNFDGNYKFFKKKLYQLEFGWLYTFLIPSHNRRVTTGDPS